VDPARTKATFADLLALGEGDRAEVIDGAVRIAPAPPPRDSRAQRVLGRCIGGPFDDEDGDGGPGGWWIFIEVDVQLAIHDVVRPDVCGWRRGRLVDPWDTRPITAVPDWICEVLSPSNAVTDRVTKRRLYARHRVPYYWLVDPGARTLEALHLRDDVWVELGSWGDGDIVRIDPFADIELDVGRLFPPLQRADEPPP
jgi:Uma2 family endonuclease